MNTIILLCLILIAAVTISYYINKEGFTDISSMLTTKDEAKKNVAAAMDAIAANEKAIDDKAVADKQLSDAIATADNAMSAADAASKKAGELLSDSTASQADKDTATTAATTAISTATAATTAKATAAAAATTAATAAMAAAAALVTATATAKATSLEADKAITDRIESDTQTLAAAAPAAPSRTDIVPDISISKNGQDARLLQQKSEMLKDIQKVVRNEILANRNTTPVMDDNSCNSGCDNKNDTNTNTTATIQGKEYASRCHKDKTCSQQPDMSQYIKKNSIPCWGCSLDY
jgi:hypothetical protein